MPSTMSPVRRALHFAVGRSSGVWNLLRSPRLRLRAFGSPIDTMLYALTISRPRVFFVQVGSNDAVAGDPLRPFLWNRHWRGLMVEPVGYVFKRLSAHYGADERFTLVNAAIGEADGPRAFYHFPEGMEGLPVWYDQLGSFSLETVKAAAATLPGLGERIQTTMVSCMTFETLAAKHAVGSLDVIHVDTEGYDYQILKLVDLRRHHPTLLIYEHKILSPADRAAAQALVRSSGYVLMEVGGDTLALSTEALSDPALSSAWNLVGGPRS
jgi:FkbM family methyltransferase